MTSKKELRAENEKLREELASHLRTANEFARRRAAAENEKRRIERQQAETNKVAEIRRGLIQAKDLRHFIADVETRRSANATRTVITLRFEGTNQNAVAVALLESLTAKTPSYSTGGIVSGINLGVGGYVTRAPNIAELSPTDRQLLRNIAEGKATIA